MPPTTFEIVSFSETYSTFETEKSAFVGETSAIVQQPQRAFPPGVYRLVDKQLMRIAPTVVPGISQDRSLP